MEPPPLYNADDHFILKDDDEYYEISEVIHYRIGETRYVLRPLNKNRYLSQSQLTTLGKFIPQYFGGEGE